MHAEPKQNRRQIRASHDSRKQLLRCSDHRSQCLHRRVTQRELFHLHAIKLAAGDTGCTAAALQPTSLYMSKGGAVNRLGSIADREEKHKRADTCC